MRRLRCLSPLPIGKKVEGGEWTYHPQLVGSERNTFVLSEDGAGAAEGELVRVPAQARCEVLTKYSLRGPLPISFSLPSTIVLSFDENRKIAVHEDRWFGRPVTYNWVHRKFKELHGAVFVQLFARRTS